MSSSVHSRRVNPRTPQISKGGACLNCRHRKIRCDGQRPVCGKCAASDIFSDCEYAGPGITRTGILEEQIATVERRIQELENPNRELDSTVSFQLYPLDVPIQVQHIVLQTFLTQCYAIGFFLDVSRFTQSILRPSTNSLERPIPAVHAAALLWGIHLSPSSQIRNHESACLSAVVQTTAQGLAASVSHPNGVIQFIQAEVLLAQYFFRIGKVLEGKYHTGTAVSLVLGSRFHKFQPSTNGNVDLVAEGEKLNGMWSIFSLSNCWAAADRAPSNFSVHEEASRIDAPWPLEIGQYNEITRLPTRTTRTVQKFLAGDSDSGTSLLAIHAKATLLFEQAGILSRQYRPNMHQSDADRFFVKFNSFSSILEGFINALPSRNSAGLLVHSLAHGAILDLHMPVLSANPNSRPRLIAAVRSLVELLDNRAPFVDPILGAVWNRACQFLIREVSLTREQGHMATLIKLVNVMSALSQTSPFIAAQLTQVQKAMGLLNA